MKKIMINGKTLTELREEIKLPRIRGWLYCPGGDDGPCKMNYRNKSGAGMSAHRGAEHDYVSPLSDFYKEAEEKRTRGKAKQSRNGQAGKVWPPGDPRPTTLNPDYYNSTKKSLVQQPKGGYHCPVNNCKFKHSHARWTNQHVFDEHGIELRRTKSHKARGPYRRKGVGQDEEVMQELAQDRKGSGIDQLEAPPTPEVVFTGINHCHECGEDLEAYHRLKLAILRAKQSGGTYKVNITVKGERYA